ncbi:hypothetical protein ABN028_29675 [Actinopolymorpha sp. B17G11]|uniref:hypothetical protein n=1 Tax=Actinopolymorpha sp. B17G11 TaxID=3160861 RepID=UPI0032E52439
MSSRARKQMRLQLSFDAAQEYGKQHPDDFGGIYWDESPVMHGALLFTGQVEDHRRALRHLVPHPDRIEVRPCRYSQAQNMAWQDQIRQRIHGRWTSLSVTTFGPSRTDIGYVPHVWIWPWSEEKAEHIRQELAPIPVELGAQPGAVNPELTPHPRPRPRPR